MKKLFKILFCSLLLAVLVGANITAQTNAAKEQGVTVKKLNFNKDKKFKIIQFTDIHYKPGNESSIAALALLGEAIDAEKPDLVVITGDLIWADPAKQCLDDVLAPIVERKVPWTYVFGNHDAERSMTREQIMDYVTKMPYCFAEAGPANIKGIGNYIVELNSSNGKELESVLYFFDSGDYTKYKNSYVTENKVGNYDWFGFDQIAWYRDNSRAYTAKNGGEPLPGLAFFHIALPEYTTMAKGGKIIGTRGENECPGLLNPGMFTAMRECGDVMGTFVGHDHDNDYIGVYNDIALAFGRYSGGKTAVYNNLGLNGCRVIELTEGSRTFSSYIRLLGGEKLYPITYPDTFKELNKSEEKK